MPDENLVILTMIGGVVSHDQMKKLLQVVFAITATGYLCNYMLQVVFAITEYTYDVIVCYNGKVRYAAQKAENGMECQVFGTAKQNAFHGYRFILHPASSRRIW